MRYIRYIRYVILAEAASSTVGKGTKGNDLTQLASETLVAPYSSSTPLTLESAYLDI